MTPLEMLKQELEASTMSPEDQKEFIWFLGRMPGRYLIDILEMSKEDPNFLPFLWTNYDKKKKAFRMNDDTLIEDIIREEKTMIAEHQNEA